MAINKYLLWVIPIILLIYNAFFWYVGFFVGIVLLVIPLIIFLLFLIIGIIKLFQKKPKMIIFSGIIFGSIIAGISLGTIFGSYEAKYLKTQATNVINGMKLYKIDNQKYPYFLDDLKPKYLNNDFSFNRITYYRFNDTIYQIRIKTHNCGSIYYSESKKWFDPPCP